MTRALERIVHHAIARGEVGCELAISSAVDDARTWISTVSIADAGATHGNGEYERPTFLLALANRTVVAHGGETTDHADENSTRLVSIRLPLAPIE